MKSILMLCVVLIPALSMAAETPNLKAQTPNFLEPEVVSGPEDSAEPVAQRSESTSLERRIEALERFAKDSSRWMQATEESKVTESRVREIVAEMIEAKLSIMTATGEKRTQIVSYAGEGNITLNPGERLLSINGYPVNSTPTVSVQPMMTATRTIRPLFRPRVVLRGVFNQSSSCRMVNGVMTCSQ